MRQHHERSVAKLRDVGVARLSYAGRVDLALLGLYSEVEEMLGRQGIPHPDVLAILQCLALVPSCSNAVEPELPEERQRNLLDQVILAAMAELGLKVAAALYLGSRQRAMRIRLQHRDGVRADMAEIAMPIIGVEGLSASLTTPTARP